MQCGGTKETWKVYHWGRENKVIIGRDKVSEEMEEEFYIETCKARQQKSREIERGWSLQSLKLITSTSSFKAFF